MDVSIIIVNHNSGKFLRDCLNSILSSNRTEGGTREIIVVDNASLRDDFVLLRRDFPDVRFIFNKENQGFGRANNLAAKEASGDLLFFLNPDTLVQEDVFNQAVKFFKDNAKLGVLAPALVLPDGRLQPWSGGRDWVSGAALFIRRKIFNEIGGFDEKFFLYFEDKDLCRRIEKQGWEIKTMSGIKVTHFGGRSWPDKKAIKKIYYCSQSYYWRKHYGLLASLFLNLIRWPYKIWKERAL